MMSLDGGSGDEVGPSPQELAAIEAEWPLIEAEMALVDAEIRLLTTHGRPSAVDWRRLRRAEQALLREWATWLASTGRAAPASRAA
jgi:hypothetical protein